MDYYNLNELTDEQIGLLKLADNLGRENFAPRTFAHDVDASFPTENYNDLRKHDLLKLCIPKAYGGLGADVTTYAMVAAEIGKHCGATTAIDEMPIPATAASLPKSTATGYIIRRRAAALVC